MVKKKGGAQHGDVRWLLSLSDFYLQLIILFLMLFIVSRVDKTKIEAIVTGIKVKKGLSTKTPKVMNKYPSKNYLPLIMSKSENLKKGYLKSIQTGTKNIKISYEILEGGVKLTLENLQFFNTGESVLLEDAKTILKEFIKEIEGYYNIIEIRGYTGAFLEDSINGDHFLLGFHRARSVYDFFKQNYKDFNPAQYRLASGGDTNLLINIPDPLAQKTNQRVEFIITPELVEPK
ncbi:MAG: flagellar motor protein MotB [Planctomycetota bacterium]